MRFETRAIHSGDGADHETGAISPLIHLSTTFERRAEDGAMQIRLEPLKEMPDYLRQVIEEMK